MIADSIGSQKKLAKEVGVSLRTLNSYISGETSPSVDKLERIAKVGNVTVANLVSDGELGTSIGFTETDTNFSHPNKVPVYGTAAGSALGTVAVSDQVIDWADRPPGLKNAQHAYALFVVGDSMVPRYHPGDIIFIHPGRPPKAGDIVVVQSQNNSSEDPVSQIKEYVSSDETRLKLCQYNERATIEINLNLVKHIHRVMTWNELLGV